MKHIWIIFVLATMIVDAQEIGQMFSVIPKSNQIDGYIPHNNYYEVVTMKDSVVRIFNVAYDNELIFGIDYYFHKKDALKPMLESLMEGSEKIAYNMWLNKKGHIVVLHNDDLIIIRDATIIRSKGVPNSHKKK